MTSGDVQETEFLNLLFPQKAFKWHEHRLRPSIDFGMNSNEVLVDYMKCKTKQGEYQFSVWTHIIIKPGILTSFSHANMAFLEIQMASFTIPKILDQSWIYRMIGNANGEMQLFGLNSYKFHTNRHFNKQISRF